MADKKDDKKKAPDAAAPAGEEGAPTNKSKLMFFVMPKTSKTLHLLNSTSLQPISSVKFY